MRAKSYSEEEKSLEWRHGDIKKMWDNLKPNMPYKRVAIVDDLDDKGTTMKDMYEYIRNKIFPDRTVEIKTCVLWHKDCSLFSPDFIGEIVSPEWIGLLREITETLEELRARKITDEPPERIYQRNIKARKADEFLRLSID